MNKIILLLGMVFLAGDVMGETSALILKFGVGLDMGVTYFISMPTSKTAAENKGWIQYTCPNDKLTTLDMYCPADDCTICLFFDSIGHLGGMQICIDKSTISNSSFDFQTQGYTSWTVTVNGTSGDYWCTYQLYMSEDYLALDEAERASSYDNTSLIQGDAMTVTGFDGDLFSIPVNDTGIVSAGFTEQNCVVWMGHHYYYNMSTDTVCSSSTIFPYFPLTKSGKLIGIGLNVFANFTIASNTTNYFESPDKDAVEFIVYKGPECMYDLVDYGLHTMHAYFISDPYALTCILQ